LKEQLKHIELHFTCIFDGCKTLSVGLRGALRLMVFQNWH